MVAYHVVELRLNRNKETEMRNPEYSEAQVKRLDDGWTESEAAAIESQYPELSEYDFCEAQENVNSSVRDDYDINNNVSVMELYAASIEGISENK